MIQQFSQANYQPVCAGLGAADADLQKIIDRYGFPPFWSRQNSFESLVHIILEQQVSLASALSALTKLKERVLELTPGRVLLLTDQEMRACYVSRQKSGYIRYLAEALLNGGLHLEELQHLPDEDVRAKLVALKGIGSWTADVYLMFALQRSDIFPIGDLAVVNALKRVKQLPADITLPEILAITEPWKPYRTLAAMLLWHYYLTSPKPAVKQRAQ